jgi:type I restriction enzyme S subunit
MSNIRPGGSFNEFHNERYLPDSYAKEYKDYLLNDGDLIIAMTDMATETKILGLPTLVNNTSGRSFLLNQRVGKLCKFSKDIYVPYLRHILTAQDVIDYYKSKGAGGLQINISKKDILSVKFPLPSIVTQKKIVAKLDGIFAEIDTATAAAEANAKNAEALFQSYLTEFFELEAKNNTSLLGEVCNVIGGGTPSKTNEEFYTGTIPWATVRDMNKDNLDITDYKITEEAVRLSATNIIPSNNVVIATRVGLGKVCILNQDTAINQDLRGVIPKSKDTLDVNYLFLWFKFIAEKIIQAGRGATVQGVTLPFIKSLAIPVPTLIKQQNTVVKIQSIFNNTELAKNSYITKINELAVLKQSILQRAFSGELVKD